MEVFIKIDGELHKVVSLAEAAKRLNIEYGTLKAYLYRKERKYRTVTLKDKKYIYVEDLPK